MNSGKISGKRKLKQVIFQRLSKGDDGDLSIQRKFFANVFPAMLAFAFSGIYAIVDGFFIGQKLGDMGLAAINVAYPITAFIQAVGTGIGMGGAIAVAICIGQKNEEGQKHYLSNTLVLIGISCIAITVLLLLGFPILLQWFGAGGELLGLAEQYTQVIAIGAAFQILGTGLTPLIRNYNGSVIAMCSMVAGFLTNVVLDWLFVMVLSYGMTGAAVATVIGQAVTAAIGALFLWKRKKLQCLLGYRPSKGEIHRILLGGLSPFGLTLSPNLVIIVINKAAFLYGGDHAVACYAVVSYVVCIVQLLLQGVGDGCQPLISQAYGAGQERDMHTVRRMAYVTGGILAVVSMVVMYSLRGVIPGVFGVSDGLTQDVAQVLTIFLLGFVFVAFLRITIPYFYAVKRTLFACLLIYGEPILLCLMALLVLPSILGVNGVWISVPAVQMILTALGIFLLVWSQKKTKATELPS